MRKQSKTLTQKRTAQKRADRALKKAALSDWTMHIRNLTAQFQALVKSTPVRPLTDIDDLRGSGLYMLYFVGKHKPVAAYTTTANRNRSKRWGEPIYIGVATTTRHKNKLRGVDHRSGNALQAALKNHIKSISSVNEHMVLDVRDFYYQALCIDPINAEIGKIALTDLHKPIWNTVVKGFANHHVGQTRYAQKRSRWDILHMGRSWGAHAQWNDEGTEEILLELEEHYAHQKNFRRQIQRENTIYKKLKEQGLAA